MSNGRHARRGVRRGRLERVYVDALAQPAEFVRDTADGFEVWKRGEILFVVPGVPDGAPPAVRAALDRRRRASLEGRCACGGRIHLRAMRPGAVSNQVFAHESDCPAADANLVPLLEAEGYRWPA